ncbi:hypothetical protein B9Z55_006424 [Caenorhabditis nigoni]|uniref:Uncharacterized protein n=1 Tax=Caenorhabditis nigoni TaxID=1611254 RepID=A0A2G5V552_9PELO|nr:hypothetical protein B9Z55_006424 [Caenorhabditis nigoni]
MNRKIIQYGLKWKMARTNQRVQWHKVRVLRELKKGSRSTGESIGGSKKWGKKEQRLVGSKNDCRFVFPRQEDYQNEVILWIGLPGSALGTHKKGFCRENIT